MKRKSKRTLPRIFKRPSTRFFVSLGLASLLSSVLLLAMYLGLVPDRDGAVRQGRAALAEAIAASASSAASQNDMPRIQAMLEFLLPRIELAPLVLGLSVLEEPRRVVAEGPLRAGHVVDPAVGPGRHHVVLEEHGSPQGGLDEGGVDIAASKSFTAAGISPEPRPRIFCAVSNEMPFGSEENSLTTSSTIAWWSCGRMVSKRGCRDPFRKRCTARMDTSGKRF